MTPGVYAPMRSVVRRMVLGRPVVVQYLPCTPLWAHRHWGRFGGGSTLAPTIPAPAYMICPDCGLPDSYRGQGDGLGSCDCPRCDCCGLGPLDDCDCSRDFDDLYDDPDEPYDFWCNDTACPVRQARAAARAAKARKPAVETLPVGGDVL